MGSIGAKGGPRSWQVAGLYVDILGLLENEARTPLRVINTSLGPVKLIPPELVLVERTLQSFYPCVNEEVPIRSPGSFYTIHADRSSPEPPLPHFGMQNPFAGEVSPPPRNNSNNPPNSDQAHIMQIGNNLFQDILSIS